MNTFCLVSYAVFLIGLSLIMTAIATIMIWASIQYVCERHATYHYQRGKQDKEVELRNGADSMWYTNYRALEGQCAALTQENNQLRKAAYPGKC